MESYGTWCAECGYGAGVDEEGLCITCGGQAVGTGANSAIVLRKALLLMSAALAGEDLHPHESPEALYEEYTRRAVAALEDDNRRLRG